MQITAKTPEQYADEIRSARTNSARLWTLVPAHLVSEMVFLARVDRWFDPATGVHRISKITTSLIHRNVEIEGPDAASGYDFEQMVMVK